MRLASLLAVLALAAAPTFAEVTWQRVDPAKTRALDSQERQRLLEQLRSTNIKYTLEDPDVEWRIHPGPLEIAGNFASDGALIVAGDLEIAGSYDDYVHDGTLIVLGDLKVDNLLTWYGLYVQGDLEARGLVYGYYNDYTFEVAGKTSARALVMFDHSADYTAGTLGLELNDGDGVDEAVIGRAITELEPDLLTDPNQLELDEYSDLLSLFPSYEAARARVHAGQPLFRAKKAGEDVVKAAAVAIAAGSKDAELAALIGKDPLVDRLIAARPTLSKTLIAQLAARRDPGVNAWLAGKTTDLAQLGDLPLTEEVASQLVANAEVAAETLLKIARDRDPAVRKTLILAEADLPDAVLAVVAQDSDPEVRGMVFRGRDYAERLSAADQARLAGAKDPETRLAVAGSPLPAALAAKLAADPDREVRKALAISLARQVDHPAPPMSTAEREVLAEKLYAGGDAEVGAAAFVALPAERQLALYRQGAKLPWDEIAKETRAPGLIAALFELEKELDLQSQLAENPALPVNLQLEMVKRAARKTTCESCWRAQTGEAVLASLLGNDQLPPAVLAAAAELALARPEADFVDPLTNHKDLPLVVLQKLDAAWAGGEEWALSLLGMNYASRAMVQKAVPRWYEEDRITRAMAALKAETDEAFWTKLAKHEIDELREAAAANVATPPALLVELLGDNSVDVKIQAAGNPATPRDALVRFAEEQGRLVDFLIVDPATPLQKLAELSLKAPTWKERSEALEAYAARKWRAW